MKTKTLCSRLLSSLLAVALLLTLAPAAFAESVGTGCKKNDGGPHNVTEWEIIKYPNCQETGARRGKCSACHQMVYEDIPVDKDIHNTSYHDNGDGTHSVAPCSCGFRGTSKEEHLYGEDGRCIMCGAVDYSRAKLELPGDQIDVKVALGSKNPSVRLSGVRVLLGKEDISSQYDIKYSWHIDDSMVGTGDTLTLSPSAVQKEADYVYVLLVTAQPKQGQSNMRLHASCSVGVHVRDLIQVQAAMSSKELNLRLGDTNRYTERSVVDQICDAVYQRTGRYPTDVSFDAKPSSKVGDLRVISDTLYPVDRGSSSLGKVSFEPAGDVTGDYVIGFTAYGDRNEEITGLLTIHVTEFIGDMDVLISTTRNLPVTLDRAAFEKFWEVVVAGGEFISVSFPEQPAYTEGTLTVGYRSTSRPGEPVWGEDEFYSEPGKNQVGIDEVTLVPNARFTGTISIPFEACGTNNRKRVERRDGVLMAVVTDGQVKDVAMSAASAAKLDTRAFQTVYQNATGNRTGSFYIQLLETPRAGELYLNYTGQGRDRRLTEAELRGLILYSSTSAAGNHIEDVTYVPGKLPTETIRYAAYTGSGALAYVGKLVLTGREIVVSYTTPTGGMYLSSAEFEKALGVTGQQAVQTSVSFGKPSSGTLRTGKGGIGTGTEVTEKDVFYLGSNVYSNVNTVSFVPASGQNAVTIPFTAVTPIGTVSGTVKINVRVSYSKKFTDVKPNDWFYEKVMDLAEAGIINGMTETTYNPNGEVTYGQALKLIMLATGYTAQEPTGKHWASGYLSRALADGLLSKSVDLDRKIDRYTIAEIAAKAMKLPRPTVNQSPFVDMKLDHASAPYVLALYEAGIVEGSDHKYNGVYSIRRSEMATIIWRINNYKK